MSRHLVVVGGGVIGLSIAWHAARQKFAVTVIDKALVGGEASWASAGLLPYVNPQRARHPLDALAAASYELHAEWYPQIRAHSGIDYEYEVAGTIHFARSRAEKASLSGLEQRCHDELIPVQRLNTVELRTEIPTLAKLLEHVESPVALKLPSDAQLRSPKFQMALSMACRQLGVRIVEEAGAVRLLVKDRRILTAETQRLDPIVGDDFIIAAGAWSAELLRPIGVEVRLVPIRGQIAYFRLARRPFVPCIYEGGNYLVARRDGGLLAGSTLEVVGFDKSTTPTAIDSLARFAGDLVPEVSERKPDRAWAGLRPATFDGFPYIGRAGEFENLFIAAGHFRGGIHLAPITAQIICELLLGESATLDINAFRVSRG